MASDKNVDSHKAVSAVIPDHIPALGSSQWRSFGTICTSFPLPACISGTQGPPPGPPQGAPPHGLPNGPSTPNQKMACCSPGPSFRTPRAPPRLFCAPDTQPAQRPSTGSQQGLPRCNQGGPGPHWGLPAGSANMAEFLWACTNPAVRVGADMGHWKTMRGAINKYFSTSLAEQLWVLFTIQDPAKRHVYFALP